MSWGCVCKSGQTWSHDMPKLPLTANRFTMITLLQVDRTCTIYYIYSTSTIHLKPRSQRYSRDLLPRGHCRGCSSTAPEATASRCQAQQCTPATAPQMARPHPQSVLVREPHIMHVQLRFSFVSRTSACHLNLSGIPLRMAWGTLKPPRCPSPPTSLCIPQPLLLLPQHPPGHALTIIAPREHGSAHLMSACGAWRTEGTHWSLPWQGSQTTSSRARNRYTHHSQFEGQQQA
jgi:hypothetical protein